MPTVKKLFVSMLLLPLCFTGTASAAGVTAANCGDLTVALETRARANRTKALLELLEKTPALYGKIGMMMLHDLNNIRNPKELSSKLYLLAIENPGMYDLQFNALALCAKADFSDSQIFDLVRNTTENIDFEKVRKEDIFNVRIFIRLYMIQLIRDGKYRQVDSFISAWFKRPGKHYAVICEEALAAYRDIIYFSCDTAPHFKSWQNNSKNSPWRAVYDSIAKKLADHDRTLYTAEDAMQRLKFYKSLNFPQTAKLAACWLKRPGCAPIFAETATECAMEMKDPQLYKLAVAVKKPDVITDFIIKSSFKDISQAQEALKALPDFLKKPLEKELTLLLLCRQQKFDKAAGLAHQILNHANAAGQQIQSFSLHSVLNAAEKQNDAALWRKAYANAGKLLQQPSWANSFGYIAAVLGIELVQADKLLKTALAARPREAAYLDSMAYIKYRRKKFADAKKYIDQSLQYRSPEIPSGVLFLHAAEIYFAVKKRDEAKKFLDRALRCAVDCEDEFDFKAAKELQEKLK